MNLNKVILIGRMAADPETRTAPSGQSVCNLRVATNRVWNDRDGQRQEQTEFHSLVAWSRLAEIASRYLRKGQLAMFEGRLQTRSWDGQDGVRRYRTEVVVENLQLGPKAAGSDNYGSSNENRQSEQAKSRQQNTGPDQIKDEDIPVINEDEPPRPDEGKSSAGDEVEEKEIDLKDIPF